MLAPALRRAYDAPVPPVLLTDRLRLDGHRADDLEPLAAMWADPRVHAMIGGAPRPREEVWLRLLRAVGQWTLLGYGMWVARDREDGGVVGEVGLIEARRAIEPPLDTPEMGWALAPAVHGRGLAGEAVAAALGWADAHGIAATCCIIDPANAQSIRVAVRAGYRPAGERTYHGQPIGVYERRAA